MRGGVLEPDLSPKSMIIVDIVISFVCMMIALIGSYFAYEDYQDSEYEDEDEMDQSASQGAIGPGPGGPPGDHNSRRTYTIGRNYATHDQNQRHFDHQPKPSQMV